MTKRSPSELFAAARAAGLTVPSAVISTAIALSESGGNDTNVGDENLETSEWGPSVGAWQIRTLKAETGTGQDRDISALQGNLPRQAQAMKDISAGGTYWQPWTDYDTGKYRDYLGSAQQAAGGTASDSTPQGTAPGPGGIPVTPAINPLDPFNISGLLNNALNNAANAAVAPARNLVLKISVVVLGLGLLGFGIAQAVHPVQRSKDELKSEAGNAESAAALL